MIRYRYRKETGSLGPISRPVASVILQNGSMNVQVQFYIDSGADLTMIPFRFGRALGLEHAPTDAVRELRGVSGVGIPYVLKNVVLNFGERTIAARVAWTLVEDVPLLLGRIDIFNQFEITFNESKGWIDFKPIAMRKTYRR